MKTKGFSCQMLLSGMIIGTLLSGCGKVSDDKIEDITAVIDSSSGTADYNLDYEKKVENSNMQQNMSNTDTDTLENTEKSEDLKLVKKYFSAITGISQEWQNGLFVVNGIDMSGNKICGIMNKDGEAKLYSNYSVLYPLEGDCMIAATDVDVTGDILLKRNLEGIQGKIINKDGDTIYEVAETEPFQRMYIVNSDHIAVLAVESGFDGLNVKWGMLDYNGNWLYPLDNGEMAEVYRKGIKMNKDGRSWNLNGILYKSVKGVNDSQIMVVTQQDSCFVYWTDDEKLVEYKTETYDPIFEFGKEKILVRNGGIEFCLFDKDGSIEEVDLKLGEEEFSNECIGVANDNAFFRVCSAYWGKTLRICDMNSREITFPENFIDRYRRVLLYNDKFYFLLEGADNNKYMAITDIEGNIISDPFLLQGSVEEWDIRGDYVVYVDNYFPYEGSPSFVADIHIVNCETKEDFTITRSYDYLDGVIFLSEDLFAVYWDKEGDAEHINYYEVYDIYGNRIA